MYGEGGNNFCGFMLLKPFLARINFSKTGMTLANRLDQRVLPNRGIIVLCRYMSDTAGKKTFQQLEGSSFTIL